MARHARLEQGMMPDPGKKPFETYKKLARRLLAPVFRFFNVDDDFPLLRRLAAATTAFVGLFFVGTLFIPFQYYLGWIPANADDLELVAISDETANDPLNNLITEEGMMIKPAIPSSAGDRSTSNQIFLYTVEPGDTLSSIAQQFTIKKETLIMENDLWNATRLTVGSRLKIVPVDGVSHQVKKGETISTLAKKYKVEAEDILRQNQLEPGQTLLADQTLIIPGGVKERPVIVATVPKPGSGGVTRGNAPRSPGGGVAAVGNGRLLWPTIKGARITQGYHGGHFALDIQTVDLSNRPIFASADGTVIKASSGTYGGGYGSHIIIDHGGGMQTLYAHCETLYVSVGDRVTQGQNIAWMGKTGNVRGRTGIHLHFEVRINGAKKNPSSYF